MCCHIYFSIKSNLFLGDPSYCQNGFTLSFWMKTESGGPQCPVSSGGDIPGDVGLAFCYSQSAGSSAMEATATVRSSSSTWIADQQNIPILTGAWNNVVLAWHPQQGLYLYVNGDMKLSDELSSNNNGPPPDGDLVLGSQPSGSRGFKGTLDEVYFWETFKQEADAREPYTSGI